MSSRSYMINVELKTEIAFPSSESIHSYLDVHIYNGGPGMAKNLMWEIWGSKDLIERGFLPMLKPNGDHIIKALPKTNDEDQGKGWKYHVKIVNMKRKGRTGRGHGYKFT